MARPRAFRAPTTASIPSNLRIPSTTQSLVKALGKLSRQSLLDLVFEWLEDRNVQSFRPYLEQDEAEAMDDDELKPYPAEPTIDDVRNAYQELQVRKGGKREVIDRILEGDWRHGITLRQLAMVDLRYMDDHPSSLRWTALELARIDATVRGDSSSSFQPDISACIPRIHASTFLHNLQQQIAPLVKAHFYLARSRSLPLTFLRIFTSNSPYQNPRQPPESLTDSSRVIYVAFPDSCPFVYTSIASSPTGPKSNNAPTAQAVPTDSRTLQRIVRDAVPKALSLPQQRYTLKATSLTAKNLEALLKLRGPGRSNQANGTFSIFADAVVEGGPLDPRPSNTVTPEEHMHQTSTSSPSSSDPEKENRVRDAQDESTSTQPTTKQRRQSSKLDAPISKKRKTAINTRFGTSGSLSTAPLDRLDVRLLDPPKGEDDDSAGDADLANPAVSLTFSGSDVISGIRKLAELGIVDPERMPSWMTGEEAVSVAVVRGGNRVLKEDG
ncbi:CENP-N/CHL4 family protein [Aspergillus candidus]|uniref:CHL4-domain-containing protein n=1 Tax=Aspergillus candidus TaxID=41067 RepID=A0A2I2EXS9_ASPCN|nr:CHL4-domain-containing protein [Aspergillus candidus]PLB33180.1 CHL4-domain-containing protein [Aspergillus candidus]